MIAETNTEGQEKKVRRKAKLPVNLSEAEFLRYLRNPYVIVSSVFYALREIKLKWNVAQSDILLLVSIKAYMDVAGTNHVTLYALRVYLKSTMRQGLIEICLKRLTHRGFLKYESFVFRKQESKRYYFGEIGYALLQDVNDTYFYRVKKFLTGKV
ncbi:MAG: hypothetical protein JRJ62_17000 [Deltaproteobacteria bacterium]|nr:hypothetical protein [Deltaproteobacteria bacterium]